MNYKKETFRNKDEWLKGRSIGGSSAASIIGLNPWMTKEELYLTLTGQKKPKNVCNELTIYGSKCEDLIRKQFTLDFPNFKVHKPINFEMYRRIDKPFMTATIDGLLTDKKTHEKWVLEIKTHDVRGREDEEKWDENIPPNYFTQCCHYLAVLDDCVGAILVAKLRWIDYETGYVAKQEYRYYYIYRSDEEITNYIKQLENAETKFWQEVEERNHPEITISF